MKRPNLVRSAGLLALGTAIGLSLFYWPQVKESLQDFLEWVRSLGDWGLAVLVVAYVPAAILFFPGSVLTLGGGFLFGVIRATIAVSAGSTVGAATAFLVGRWLARDWIAARIKRNPKFQAIDQAVADQGFKIVLLTRLSPVFPFTVLNYAFGLTRVRFRDYVLASWIGMLPGTILYAYLGSAVQDLASLAGGNVEGGTARKVFFFAGLAATAVVTIYVTRVAKAALDRAIPPVLPGTNHTPQA